MRIFALSIASLLALLIFRYCLSLAVNQGIAPVLAITWLSLAVAVAAFIQCYMTIPTCQQLADAKRKGWPALIICILNGLIALILCALSLALAAVSGWAL